VIDRMDPDKKRTYDSKQGQKTHDHDHAACNLANTTRVLATFSFKDRLRRQASELITCLKALGLNLVILSSNQIELVEAVTD
jgi:cation transport ATPase